MLLYMCRNCRYQNGCNFKLISKHQKHYDRSPTAVKSNQVGSLFCISEWLQTKTNTEGGGGDGDGEGEVKERGREGIKREGKDSVRVGS